MKKKVFAFLFSLPLLACNSNPELETFYYREFGIFNSEFAVTYNAERSLEEEIDTFLSAFTLEADPYSQHKGVNGVYEINQTNEPVEVSDDLYNAIDRAWTIKSETEGYFNPLIFNLSSLWKKTLFGGIIPDPDYVPTSAKIDAAKIEAPALLEEMNNGSLILDAAKKTVQRVGSAKLDLGGIAKGYAVEKVDSILKAVLSASDSNTPETMKPRSVITSRRPLLRLRPSMSNIALSMALLIPTSSIQSLAFQSQIIRWLSLKVKIPPDLMPILRPA